MPSQPAARKSAPVRPCRTIASVLVVVLVLLPDSGLEARDPSFEQTLRDMRLTIRARKMLLEDPHLGSLNLGVRVEQRIAVLWGPVPSVEIGWQAEERLRTMIELAEIRNEMLVLPEEGSPLPPQRLDGPGVLPELLPPVLPGRPAPLIPKLRSTPSTDLVLR